MVKFLYFCICEQWDYKFLKLVRVKRPILYVSVVSESLRSLTVHQLRPTDHPGTVASFDGVREHGGALVGVDQRRHGPQLRQAEPDADHLRSVLHQQPDVIAFLHSLRLEVVSHLVTVVFHLSKDVGFIHSFIT